MRLVQRVEHMQALGILVQARMDSSRLPGKVLAPLAGKPMLAYVLDRVLRCKPRLPVAVCTSSRRCDDPIAHFCAARAVDCYRGSHDNVAARCLRAAEHFGFDAFVRVCGDSPLIDPRLIDRAVEIFASRRYDLVTNGLDRSFPAGQTVEVIDLEAFDRGFMRMYSREHFEHVTRYFYERADLFRIFNFTTDRDAAHVKLAVDTPSDLERIEELVASLDRPHWQFGWEDFVDRLVAVAC